MTLDSIDPDAIATGRLVKAKIPTPYVAPTSPTAVVLGQLAAGTVILANSMFDKRRERAAQKNITATKAHLEDRKAGIVRTPSPFYKPPHPFVEIPLPGVDPRSAQTPEEFVAKMRQLKTYTELTLREIEDRAGTFGALPKSTLSDALKSKSLPKRRVLRPFLRACGLTDEHIAEWENTHLRIAIGQIL